MGLGWAGADTTHLCEKWGRGRLGLTLHICVRMGVWVGFDTKHLYEKKGRGRIEISHCTFV